MKFILLTIILDEVSESFSCDFDEDGRHIIGAQAFALVKILSAAVVKEVFDAALQLINRSPLRVICILIGVF